MRIREAVSYVVILAVVGLIVVACNDYRNDRCEAKGGHRAYAHAWYERSKHEQKVCISDDGRLLR